MGINVLSLFDGMSGGQIALERAGIDVDNYFASEIDKYAIKVTQKNYPNTIQLGDVTKWKEWHLPKIDLLIGGSPCQGFSFAGKGLNFEDPRSKLFFEYVDVLNFLRDKNPENIFLLENVKMKKGNEEIISEYLGVEPVSIDSALVSAQARKRLYWSNLAGIEPPVDKCIFLKDVVENGIPLRDKSYCIDSNYYKGGTTKNHGTKEFQKLRESERRNIIQIDSLYKNNGQAGRVYSIEGKSVTLRGEAGGMGGKTGLYSIEGEYRKLTPLECERLQTVPEGYTEGVSNTQRYKMLGNGWTIDVIAHIFGYLPDSFKLSIPISLDESVEVG